MESERNMEFGTEILTFQVEITGADEVKGHRGEACMVHFAGICDCPLFRGKILPGGVDTQRKSAGEPAALSARYILEGIDCEGQTCRIFVENNAVVSAEGQIEYTIPEILTDSAALSFLETADLKGTITPAPNGVIIHIWKQKN